MASNRIDLESVMNLIQKTKDDVILAEEIIARCMKNERRWLKQEAKDANLSGTLDDAYNGNDKTSRKALADLWIACAKVVQMDESELEMSPRQTKQTPKNFGKTPSSKSANASSNRSPSRLVSLSAAPSEGRHVASSTAETDESYTPTGPPNEVESANQENEPSSENRGRMLRKRKPINYKFVRDNSYAELYSNKSENSDLAQFPNEVLSLTADKKYKQSKQKR